MFPIEQNSHSAALEAQTSAPVWREREGKNSAFSKTSSEGFFPKSFFVKPQLSHKQESRTILANK